MLPEPSTNQRALRREIDLRLEQLLKEQTSARVGAVVRDAVLGPGHRLRPLLLMLSAKECGAPAAQALDLACALEMVHAASLVIDDLPAMDDAKERRGRPAIHVQHGQAAAILAAIALLARAFAVVGQLPKAGAGLRVAMSQQLADLVDTLVSGQLDELQHVASVPSSQRHLLPDIAWSTTAARQRGVEDCIGRKTAAAFVSAVQMAVTLTPLSVVRSQALLDFAKHLGHAYQIDDDLRDVDEDVGRDTYVTVLGRPAAQALLLQHLAAARTLLPRQDGALGTFAATLFAGAWAAAA